MARSTSSKFGSTMDEYVYQVSLEGGCDMEVGSSSEGPAWFGLMRHGHTIFRDHDPLLDGLLDEREREYLPTIAGAILREDSDGFVAVSYYKDMDKLDRAWGKIEAEFDNEWEDEDSEEDDS